MERNKKTPVLFLLLALLHVCPTRSQDCCSLPNNNLTCYSDFNRTITCVWNSTYVSDTECTIHAKKVTGSVYSASCDLKPVDISRPMLKKCSLDFIDDWIFQTKDELSINLNCVPEKQSLEICYKPACHIKLNPPPKPDVNSTAISWFPQVNKHERIRLYISQLQWKREDCSWSDPSVKTVNKEWNWSLTVAQIPDSDLLMGERYEARVRVQGSDNWAKSTWSDWSPVASWESTVGKTKPTIDGAEVFLALLQLCSHLPSF
ncbi:cytokine receptor common subunit beta-like isoform X2 [Micropterus salmoides]|uniref:cytokine receptor common subunit beta-like isoform X2 n=1 Tax=Micropterus salmoides TaxID=27706 RepID=UPI0018EB7A33|nr:cytokine receptor common subunit beta-like isoform X2 [Micropterus salmoides]